MIFIGEQKQKQHNKMPKPEMIENKIHAHTFTETESEWEICVEQMDREREEPKSSRNVYLI